MNYLAKHRRMLIDSSMSEWLKTWEGIVATRGAYFQLGDLIQLDLGTIDGINCGSVRMQKVAANEANAKSVWMAKDFLATAMKISDVNNNDGGWGACDLRDWLNGAFLQALPYGLPNAIVAMTRYARSYESGVYITNAQYTDKIFIPSVRELNGTNSAATLGPTYRQFYPTQASRVKTLGIGGSTYRTWLRDVSSISGYFYGNGANGADGTGAPPTALGGITLCFGL